MKRLNNLYNDMCDLKNIVNMTDKVCSSVRNKKKVDRFEIYKSEHVLNIKKRLEEKNTNIYKYNIFMITDPKCRVVMSLDIEDKIINHLISKYILEPVFENKYTNSMVATRVGKGTSYGIKLLRKYLNIMKKKYNNFYILKIDISKYFYNINHDVLKSILEKNIKDKDALKILYSVINSTNLDYINKEIIELKEERINYLNNSNLKNKNKLIREVEVIPLYPYDKGMGLGNQTSQNFGLIYLYELNHYIKEKLHIKYIINYMDDFILIHSDKKYLEYCLLKIKNILENKYKLKINENKTRIDSIKNGIEFLGYRFYIKDYKLIIKLKNNTKKRFKMRVKKLKLLKIYNYITNKEFYMILSSYKGLLKHGGCKNLYYKTINVYKKS